MACPKCKSLNVTEAMAGTYRCDDCDHAWVPYNTAPRLPAAPVESSSVGIVVLVALLLLISVALGFVSMLLAIVIGVLGLLAGILFYLAKIANRE